MAMEELIYKPAQSNQQKYWSLLEDVYHFKCALENSIAFYMKSMDDVDKTLTALQASPVTQITTASICILKRVRKRRSSLKESCSKVLATMFYGPQPYSTAHLSEVEHCIEEGIVHDQINLI